MSVWRQVRRGLDVLLHRDAADRELTDEMEHFLGEATAAHVARGLSPEEAGRVARVELGSVAAVRQEVRGVGWERVIETTLGDVRFALRGLLGSPGFTVVTLFTLALGIGATTAILSVVTPILFRPLPYPRADRLATVVEVYEGGGRSAGSFAMFHAFADQSHSFEALAVAKTWQPTITGRDRPDRLEGERVSNAYLKVLGVTPSLGRDFTPTEDRMNGPRVVILSDGVWRARFAADPAILGSSVMLDGDPYQVIGVMPPGFRDAGAPSAEIWSPLQYDLAQGRAWGHHLRTLGRLRPGVGFESATRDIESIGRATLTLLRPETYDANTHFQVASLQQELTRGVRPALLTILGAVVLVLLIALVNVTNLLMARGVQRRAEFALRTALGAGQGRLMRQMLTESFVLAALGGAIGLVVAAVSVRGLVALTPGGLPRTDAIAVDGTVFLLGAGITTLVGLVVGAAPALSAARTAPQTELQRGSSRTAGGHRRARGVLVISEVALALVLLVGSGLLLRSLSRVLAVDIGFDRSPMLTMQVQLAGHRFDSDTAAERFFTQALDAVRQVPGVTAAGFTTQLPLSPDDDEYGAHFDADARRPATTYDVFRYAVSPGYVEAMGVPLRAGRLLDDRDRAGAPLVALVSGSLARERFGRDGAVGRQMTIGSAGPYTIIGVVGDVHQASLAQSQPEAVYVPAGQWKFVDRTRSLVVRGRGNVEALGPAVEHAVWSVDKDQAITRVATMGALVARSTGERRFVLTLSALFAVAALCLAAAGIYGVLSGSVSERRRELGIRAALGASRRDVVQLVLVQGAALTGTGVAIGLAGGAAVSRIIAGLLFDTPPVDPGTYASATFLLGIVALIACLVPATRAAGTDPMMVLRGE